MSNPFRGQEQSFDVKAVYCCCNSVGGSGGRPHSAGNSFHPCLHGERKAHGRTASSRKGMLPKNANRSVNSLPQIKLFEFIFTFRFCLFCQLNIYTPLPQSAQAQVVPERSGIIQSGITTAREGIQPFAQASKVLILISHLTLHQCLIVDRFCQTDSTTTVACCLQHPTPTYWQIWMRGR